MNYKPKNDVDIVLGEAPTMVKTDAKCCKPETVEKDGGCFSKFAGVKLGSYQNIGCFAAIFNSEFSISMDMDLKMI